MHLGQKIDFSTFRWTLAALLRASLKLQHVAPRRLAPVSESALTEWMLSHLMVVTVPYADRATLGAIEEAVLEALDPPLNLMGMHVTPVRGRLKQLRAVLATSPLVDHVVDQVDSAPPYTPPPGMLGTLVVAPCGRQKIWDLNPNQGPTEARDAYTSQLFRRFRAYAEQQGDAWVILSAKYGFIKPEFLIRGTYNVTFNDSSTNPVTDDQLRSQVTRLGLDRFEKIVGLGGARYREVIRQVFGGTGAELSFPFAGLPIGKLLQALDVALKGSQPATEPAIRSGAASTRASWRDIMQQADSAKRTLRVSRAEGENEFRRLLERYPEDGMLYLRRGEGRMEVGDFSGAESDLLRAEELLPRAEWKQRAREARRKLPATEEGIAAAETGNSHSYVTLTRWLSGSNDGRVRLTFAELSTILGRTLPASATAYRTWWANSRSSQAHGWLDAGFQVTAVDLQAQIVTFSRSRA
jgi:hypothetical protein